MVLKSIDKHRYLLHFLPVLLGLQVLHKDLGGPEVFLADCAGGDGCSAGKLRRDGRVLFKASKAPHLHHENVLVCEVSFTLCSSVRRWSVMLLVKWM